MNGKVIILSAPSGAGKSTLVQYLLKQDLSLQFSVSATSRPPRGNEKDGVDYRFLTTGEFRAYIRQGWFLEYEEVYPDILYGTLKSEVERILASGNHVLFDVDAVGGCNIKKYYGNQALSIFIQPPSVDELKKRLERRGTDSPKIIRGRLAKAALELEYAQAFDLIIVNDSLEQAQAKILQAVQQFIMRE
jgi:guanylate kinase